MRGKHNHNLLKAICLLLFAVVSANAAALHRLEERRGGAATSASAAAAASSRKHHHHSLRTATANLHDQSGDSHEKSDEEHVEEEDEDSEGAPEDEEEEEKPKRVDIREVDPDLQATVRLSPLEEKEKERDVMQKKREKIAALLWLEGRLRDMHRELDETVFENSIEEEERNANGEVGMPEMVNTLSEMRKELHRYAAPVYQKVVDEALMQVAGKRLSLLEEMQDKTRAEPIPDELLSEQQKHKDGGKIGQAILASSAIFVIAALLVMHRATTPT
mmetsp:Transcript_11863/g.26185  ORF Transcript_11863/g.26185 Transcript_11863/m.26185 type:complete len:275 (-) Transcript_11863:26-850(-)